MDENDTLYFATDGMVGFGGMDIVKVPFSVEGTQTPEILPPPFNSYADDFTYKRKDEAYYISTNRSGKDKILLIK
jgi:hypothetical protein